jgi:hypothetical protein
MSKDFQLKDNEFRHSFRQFDKLVKDYWMGIYANRLGSF